MLPPQTHQHWLSGMAHEMLHFCLREIVQHVFRYFLSANTQAIRQVSIVLVLAQKSQLQHARLHPLKCQQANTATTMNKIHKQRQ
jgi:hypothetical protein